MKFFEELKRRNVIKATIAYVLVAWILLQLIATILPIFEAPPWVFKTLTFIIAIGLPIWMIFSWVYEVTPEGLNKTSKISDERSITDATNKRLNVILISSLIIAVGVALIIKQIANPFPKTNDISDLTANKSIAVLPFENMSGDPDQETMCDGLTEEIIHHLSTINLFDKVISRSSVMTLKDSEKTTPEIASMLDVNFILEGSYRQSGKRLRITAQLIEASNDKHLWSEIYERPTGDIFDI